MKTSKTGYKRNSKDKNEPALRIPSNQITMKGVDFPVYGIDDTGHAQMMYPGYDYVFPGSTVYEYPMMQTGGNVGPYTTLAFPVPWWFNPSAMGTDSLRYFVGQANEKGIPYKMDSRPNIEYSEENPLDFLENARVYEDTTRVNEFIKPKKQSGGVIRTRAYSDELEYNRASKDYLDSLNTYHEAMIANKVLTKYLLDPRLSTKFDPIYPLSGTKGFGSDYNSLKTIKDNIFAATILNSYVPIGQTFTRYLHHNPGLDPRTYRKNSEKITFSLYDPIHPKEKPVYTIPLKEEELIQPETATIINREPEINSINLKQNAFPVPEAKLEKSNVKIPSTQSFPIMKAAQNTHTGQYRVGTNYWDPKTKSWKQHYMHPETQTENFKEVEIKQPKTIIAPPQLKNGGWLDTYQDGAQVGPRIANLPPQQPTPNIPIHPVLQGYKPKSVPGTLGSMTTVYENPKTKAVTQLPKDVEKQQASMDMRGDADRFFNDLNPLTAAGSGAFYGISNIAQGNVLEGALELGLTSPLIPRALTPIGRKIKESTPVYKLNPKAKGSIFNPLDKNSDYFYLDDVAYNTARSRFTINDPKANISFKTGSPNKKALKKNSDLNYLVESPKLEGVTPKIELEDISTIYNAKPNWLKGYEDVYRSPKHFNIDDLEIGDDISLFSGGAFNSGVYKLPEFPGYLLKQEKPISYNNIIPNYDQINFAELYKGVETPNLGKIIKQHQKILRGDEKLNKYLMREVSGEDLLDLSPDQLSSIPNNSWVQFLKDSEEFAKNNLAIDHIGKNIKYNFDDKAFKFFDLSPGATNDMSDFWQNQVLKNISKDLPENVLRKQIGKNTLDQYKRVINQYEEHLIDNAPPDLSGRELEKYLDTYLLKAKLRLNSIERGFKKIGYQQGGEVLYKPDGTPLSKQELELRKKLLNQKQEVTNPIVPPPTKPKIVKQDNPARDPDKLKKAVVNNTQKLSNYEEENFEQLGVEQIAAGLGRLVEKNIDEDPKSKVRLKPEQPVNTLPYGYKQLSAVKDAAWQAGATDSLSVFRNVWDNDQGFNYIVGNKALEVTKGNAPSTFNNVETVAHFLRDSDILPNQQFAPDQWKVGKWHIMKSTTPGKALSTSGLDKPDAYRMLYKQDADGTYNIKYKRYKDLTEQEKKEYQHDLVVQSHSFADIAWDKEGKSTGYSVKSKFVPTVDGSTSIPYKDKDSFSRFSGGSVIFQFTDPKTNKRISVDFAGSVNAMHKEGQRLIKMYNLDPKKLDLMYHDMGSYSAKPKALNGKLDYNQWLNYNQQNQGFSGAPLIIPKTSAGNSENNSYIYTRRDPAEKQQPVQPSNWLDQYK